MKKILITYIVIALLGLVDSVYLTYTRLLGITPPCGVSIFSGCAVVARSAYSVLLGIPLSVYGIVFYGISILIAAILLYKNIQHGAFFLMTVSTAGLVSSLYFIYIQIFVIKALCIYCVFSAICALALFVLALFLYRKNK